MLDTYCSIALTEPCSAIPARRAESKSTNERCSRDIFPSTGDPPACLDAKNATECIESMFSDCFVLRIGFHKPNSSSIYVSKICKGLYIEFMDNFMKELEGKCIESTRSRSALVGGMGI